VERTYAVIKQQFHAGNVLVTTVARASLQNLFACFDYNLAQLRTIHRQALEEQ
jgi:IS5 family transposase